MTQENIAHLIEIFATAYKLFKPEFVRNLEVDGQIEQNSKSD